jgi:type IV pilus assembly protein PilF
VSKSNSNKAMLYTNAGLCAKRFDLPRAEGYLRGALAADPNYRDALLQLADVTYSRGNYLQARAFLERYTASSRISSDALWLGYRIEKALGEGPAANRYADRLKKEFPTSVETGELLESERNGR